MLKKLLIKAIRETCSPAAPVALLLSGGIDSSCLLFACLELGLSPHCYTYSVENEPSFDRKQALRLTAAFGLRLEEIVIPAAPDKALAAIRTLLRLGVRGQVALQCMHGHLYVAPYVQEPLVLNGSGVDALLGSYHHENLAFRVFESRSNFDKMRAAHLQDADDDCMMTQQRLYASKGVRTVFPYRHPGIVVYLMGLSWSDINHPRLKTVSINAFGDWAVKVPGFRWRRGAQQLVAGTKRLHLALLSTTANRKRRRALPAFYRDLEEELGERK